MSAASKLRKSDSGTPTSDDPIEVVVEKSDKPAGPATPTEPKSETKKPRAGMKLPAAKPKEEPEEINWDEIEADLKPVEEPEVKGGWGEGVNRTNTHITRLKLCHRRIIKLTLVTHCL